jgi:hypothetical protein
MRSYISHLLFLALLSARESLCVSAFTTPGSKVQHRLSKSTQTNQIPFKYNVNLSQRSQFESSTTSLQMGYNLPPGGGGSGGDGDDKIMDILTPIAGIAGLTLFFMSPLGGIFFAITNSLFVLALITPILIGVGFNVWKTFYTIEAECPSCGSPASVLKDEDAGPNVCLSCGQLIRATASGDGIELCNDPNDIFDEKSRVSSIFDIFTSDRSRYEEDVSSTTFVDSEQKKKDKTRRETTVIDVDVETD